MNNQDNPYQHIQRFISLRCFWIFIKLQLTQIIIMISFLPSEYRELTHNFSYLTSLYCLFLICNRTSALTIICHTVSHSQNTVGIAYSHIVSSSNCRATPVSLLVLYISTHHVIYIILWEAQNSVYLVISISSLETIYHKEKQKLYKLCC